MFSVDYGLLTLIPRLDNLFFEEMCLPAIHRNFLINKTDISLLTQKTVATPYIFYSIELNTMSIVNLSYISGLINSFF